MRSPGAWKRGGQTRTRYGGSGATRSSGGSNHPDEYMFVQQFRSSPFIKKLPPEEVLKDAAAAFEVLTEIIGESCLRDMEIEVAFAVIYSPIDAVVRSIINSGGDLERDRLIDASFGIVWRGMTGE